MIKIPSFDYDTFISGYPEGSIERQILETMEESSGVYSFQTVGELKFELALRREIVKAAQALYQSGMGFAVFEETVCNPVFWDRKNNGGFLLKRGVKASDAIEDIFTNGHKYATECATAMVIVYYKALLDLLGADQFNQLFDSIYLMNWSVRDPLLRAVSTPRKVKDHLLGDRVYFANPEVSPETPWWQGENVIVLQDSLYYGHGIGIQDADTIIAALNSQRKEGAVKSAYLMDEAGRPDFKKLYEATRQTSAVPSSLIWDSFPTPIPLTI